MKKIHPKYEEVVVTCVCGHSFKTKSTSKKIHLDICSQCHPFYTGQQKFIDTAGRVEKFKTRYKKTEGKTVRKKVKKAVKKVKGEIKVKKEAKIVKGAKETKEPKKIKKVKETKENK